ncbi:MAG TPA: prepilin-type N-terminal cleavage/methylation domain-containing protein [Vicinamibacterales bacterium]|nr:prepilin-type N-terminal cleavage/methylation domain-containing protein [Vicinamibacterales bacterium]
MNDRGFTLVELLVACLILSALSAAVVAMSLPSKTAFERTLASADLAGAARTALDRLTLEAREAGSGPTIIAASFAAVMNVAQPIADLETAMPANPGEGVRLLTVERLAPQGVTTAPAAAGDSVITVDTGSLQCTQLGAACGLRGGMLVAIVDSARAELHTVTSVSGGAIRLQAPLAGAFAAQAAVAAVSRLIYGLRRNADGSARLVRLSAGGAEQPLVSNVAAFRVTRLDRALDIVLRIEAASAAFRGAGGLFIRPGSQGRASQWIPDLGLRATIALRNTR